MDGARCLTGGGSGSQRGLWDFPCSPPACVIPSFPLLPQARMQLAFNAPIKISAEEALMLTFPSQRIAGSWSELWRVYRSWTNDWRTVRVRKHSGWSMERCRGCVGPRAVIGRHESALPGGKLRHKLCGSVIQNGCLNLTTCPNQSLVILT